MSEIQTEYELYEYLKDGAELCRMVGVITQGRVLDGIVYRANNIAALEEKNIALFLSFVDQKLGLPQVFGGHGSKVFQKFATFYVALLGLARVSKNIERTHKIPKFYCSGRKTQLLYSEDNNYKANDIQGYREAEYDQRMNIIEIERAQTSLDFAIEELIDFNARFLREVLEPMKRCEEKNSNDLLKREFFPVFQLEKLAQLHMKLKFQFERLEYSYIEIGRIFNEVKDDFLIYSTIVAQMKIVMGFFADQMSENEEVIESVAELEQGLEGSSIKELAQLIPHFAMKWSLVLESVRTRAYKERRQGVESEARKAHQLIVDVFDQMERVSADFQYKEAMGKFVKEIQGIDEFGQFGVLVKEVNDVDCSMGSRGENFKKVDLLITDECVIVMDLKARFEHKRSRMFGTVKKVLLPEKARVFTKCFQIIDFDQITIRDPGGSNLTLWIRRIKDLRPDEAKSFVLKLPRDLAFEIEQELRMYHKRNAAKVQEGSNHLGHSYNEYRGRGDLTECGLRCGECQQLMHGLLFFGIKCETCNGIFHKECFSANKSADPHSEDEEDEDVEEPLYNIIQKRFGLELEDFFVPGADQAKAQELLSKRKLGAFLMISTGPVKWLIVNKKDRLGSYEIKMVKVHGEALYYMEKGTSAKSVVDLVSKHRRTHLLLTPIRLKDLIEDDDETDQEGDEEDDESGQEMTADGVEDSVEAHSSYFWGNITAPEAEQLLRDVPPGTFLLRKKEDEFRISWKSFGLELNHAVIKTVSGGFQMMKVTFKSLDLLMAHFQKYDRSSGRSLGSPLLREADSDKEEELQRGRNSARVPGFQGTLSAREAEEMLLIKAQGTYLVRRNVKGNYEVSYKSNNKVLHLKLGIEGKGYLATPSENERVFATSLGRMVDKLKFKGLFSFPLQEVDLSFASVHHINTMLPRDHEGEDQDVRPPFRRQSTIGNGESVRCMRKISPSILFTARPSSAPLKRSAKNWLDMLNNGAPDNDNDAADEKEFNFLHNINKTEAKGILFDKPVGTWILYYTKDTKERIAFKDKDKVKQMEIISKPSGFAFNEDDEPVKLEELIYRLQGQGVLKKQLSHFENEESDEEEN